MRRPDADGDMAGVLNVPTAEAYSSGITGRTQRDGGAGCTTSCHSGTTSGTVSVSINGPTSLSAGQTGNYTVTNNSTLSVAGRAAGANIASSDGTLNPSGNLTSNGATELYHFTPNSTDANGDTVFSFSWTMPGAAGTGTGHTIYATGRVWYSGNWAHATNFGVTTVAPFTALVNGSATPGSISVGGTGPLSTSGGAGAGGVSYVSSNNAICTVSGTTVNAVGVGSCTITANKAADGSTSALSDAVSFSVVQAVQTITFAPVAPKLTTDAPFGVSASGGGSGNPIVYSTSGVCSNSGATITLTGAVGICSVTANQAGNTNYLAATPVIQNISVVTAGEVFPPNCQVPLGWITAPGAMTGWDVATDQVATGSCSLKSNVLPSIGTNLSARIQFTGTFLAGNVSFSRRVSTEPNYDCLRFLVDGVEQGVGGTCPNLGLYVPGVLIGASGELAYATVTVPITAGAHTLIWSYDKDTTCCTGGLDAVWIDNVTLPLAPPAIISALTANGFFGQSFMYAISASNSPWGFSATGLPPGLTVSTSGVVSGVPTTVGSYTMMVTASSGAGTVTAPVTVTINPQPQVISFPAINNKLTTASLFGANATGNPSSGIPVIVTSSTTSVCLAGGVNGSTIQIVAPGTCTLTANQAGNTNYSAAAPVVRSFLVSTAASELFPTGCTFPAGWATTVGATTGWILDNGSSSSGGACSLRSNAISSNQTAKTQFTATFAAGTIEFKVNTSSEGYWDCFFVYVDGVKQSPSNGSACALGGTGFSGATPYTTVTIPIAAGSHQIIFSYEKDSIFDVGSDAAWIDDLVFPQYTLTVNKTGSTGTGLVFSDPSGIACGSTCSSALSGAVSLSAFPNPGSYLSSWSGGGCSGNGACIVNLTGNTTLTANFALIVAPTAPQMVSASPGNSQATISFAAPTSNGGAPITIYTSTCTASGQPTRTDSAANSPITATGLANGVQYSCTVTASNSGGFTSVPSAASLVTPRTVPDAPTGLVGTPGNGTISIAFVPPANNGGAMITSYQASCIDGMANGLGTSAGSPVNLSGLVNGNTYTCSVRAFNTAGFGPFSSPINVTPRTTPGIPTSVGVSPRDGRAVFSFNAPASDGGSAITVYTVSCNGGAQSASDVGAPITVSGLANGMLNNCQITASNVAGIGTAANVSVTPGVQSGTTYWAQICTACHAMTPALPQLNAAGTTAAVLNYAITNQPLMSTNGTVTSLTQAERIAVATYLATVRPAATATTPFNTPVIVDLAAQLTLGTISFESMEIVSNPMSGSLSMLSGTQVTFTPAAGFVGMMTFTVRGARAMPTMLQGDPITVTATVNPPPVPVVSSSLMASGTNGVAFMYQIIATNIPTSYSATGLPPGLLFNSGSGVISGTPTAGGTYMVSISATNQGGTGMASNLVLTLNPAVQVITFPAQSPTQPFSPGGTFPISPLATASSSLPVSYVSKTSGVCTVSMTTVTIVTAGICTIGANQAGDVNFAAAVEATRDVTITPTLPGAPNISMASPGNNQAIVAFSAPANTGGVAISGYTATCTAMGQSTRTGTGSMSPVVVSGMTNQVQYSCAVTATNSQGTGPASGNALVTPDQIPTAPMVVSAASASFTVNAPGSFSVVATGYPTNFSYAVMGTLPMGVTLNAMTGVLSGTPASAGTFMITISVTNTGGTAMQSFTLTVNMANQTISFTNPGTQAFGGGTIPLTAAATSGLAVTFISDTIGVCTVAVSNVTLVSVGTCTIRAQQSGSANFNTAPDVPQSFTVAQGSQTISFGAQTTPRSYAVGGTFGISPLAGASSILPVTYSSLTTSVCTLVGTTLTMVRAGVCTIAANQSGNANFAAAAQVTQSVTINATTPAAPTLNSATGGDQKITVVFTAAANDGGSAITNFTATCGGFNISAATSPIAVTGLTNTMSYSCTVTATNASMLTSMASNAMMATANVLPGKTVWDANCNSGGCHAGNPVLFRLNAGGTTSTVLNYVQANPGTLVPGLMVTVLGNLTAQQKLDLAAYIAEFVPAVSATTAAGTPVDISVASQVYLNTNTLALTGLQQVGAPANGSLSFPGGTTITYTPNMGFTGSDSFTYRGFSGSTQTDARTVTVTVTPAAPVISSSLAASGTISQAFAYQIAASNAPTSYGAAPLPAGLMVNSGNGQITGTPSAAGSTNVTISAGNTGGTGMATLVITISLVPQTITFGAQASPVNFIQGGSFMIAPTATGGASGNPIVYSSTTTSVCSVSGTVVNLLAAGVCTIAANQAGNATYAAAAQVTRSVTINGQAPAAPTIGTGTAGNTQATVAFTPPSNTGGLPITLYTVSCNGITNTGSGSPVTVSGLTNGTPYTCSVQATNAAGTSVASGTVMVTPVAIAFNNIVYSRKNHGGVVGDKNITLNHLATFGAATVEPRTGSGGHKIVFVFNNPVSNVTSLSVVDAMDVAIPGAVAASTFNVNNELIVTVTGLPENIRVTVKANGVNNALNVSTPVAFLIGDVSGNSRINATDIAAVKARISQNVSTGNNFLFDLNLNGAISSADVSTVKARSGIVLP